MKNTDLIKNLGKRILSEANDLKRTVSSLAKDINVDEEFITKVIDGDCEIDDSYEIIKKMGKKYPIDISDLFLIEDDCKNSIKIMRSGDSINSSRIFNRMNKEKTKSPYYEYRDTVYSRLSPYKPEWIKQLRYVENNDPYNSDVIYNNGHFMHQITFFVGPVNFYWEINGEKFCKEMNTGDSNYITPYWPHSFTSRNLEEEAYIVAITFGADSRIAQKELYALGSRSNNYILDYRNHNKAIKQLIEQHMINENLSIKMLTSIIKKQKLGINIEKILVGNEKISLKDLKVISKLLNVELYDLMLPVYNYDEEVVVKHTNGKNKYFFPDDDNIQYRIEQLARTSKMPQVKAFSIEVLTEKLINNMVTSLHTYIFNYGEFDIEISWEHNGSTFNEVIKRFDSVYIQPFIKHGFSFKTHSANLFLVRVAGSINLSTQRELSYMANIDRTYNETKPWF